MSNFFFRAVAHIKTVLTHKKLVHELAKMAGIEHQGITHDLSKFSPTELFESIKYYTDGKQSPILACRKAKGYSRAWTHHIKHNKHHLEYWIDEKARFGAKLMPYKYWAELICDNLAAGMTYKKENASISSENTIPAISVLGKKVTCDDLYPTDQPEQGAKKECVTELVVKNLSTLNVKYDLYLLVGNNTYTSSNFKYKITSTNGGGNMNNYVTAPTTDTLVFKKVSISPLSTQVYNISFILEGTNAEQNYDWRRSNECYMI